MQKEFQLAVDIEKKILTPSFEVNTLDLKTIKLKITITKGMTLVDLTDITVRMSIRKPDGNVLFQDCQVVNAKGGQVEIILENQAYIMPGSYSAEIMCFKGADKVAVTGSFSYRSIRGIMDDKAIESKSEFTAITGMIGNVEAIVTDLKKNGTGIDAQARQEVQQVSEQSAGVAKKTEAIISVKEFGAVGDGIADDTRAFKEAYLQVKSNGGGTVKIPQGVYNLTSQITADHNNRITVSFKGEGFPVVNINHTGIGFYCGNTEWKNTLTTGYGVTKFENLYFKSNNRSATTIHVESMRTLLIDNVRIEGFLKALSLYGCWSGSNFKKLIVNGLNIENSIGVEVLDRVNFCTFDKVALQGLGTGAIYSASQYENTTNLWLGCDFEGCKTAFEVSGASTSIWGIELLACNFESNANYDILVKNNAPRNNIRAVNSTFYYGGIIQFGDRNTSGFNLRGMEFVGNYVASTKNSHVVLFGTESDQYMFDSICDRNTYAGTNTQIEKPLPPARFTTSKLMGVSKQMPRYETKPTRPSTADWTIGVTGDLRWDDNAIYLRTENQWKFSPTLTIDGYYSSEIPSMKYGASPPTEGTWKKNDQIINRNPTAGGYMGWVCVANGTPGTWKGYGLIQS